MEFAIAKVSSKGQIVIPSQMRNNIRSGDEFLIVKDQNRIVLKDMKNIAEEMKDDLGFARRIDKAWKEYEKGMFNSKSKEAFLADIDSW